jgi:pteridine reductase
MCYLDPMQVKGKLAVVTGGARRVGAAIVEALAGAGARPIVHYHQSRAEAERLAARFGGVALPADLARPDGAAELCRAVESLEGELAVWVNSASALEQVAFLESDDQLWARTLQLTLQSPVSCARAAARRLVEGGVIVNVLDVAAHQPWKGFAHHCVAKAGLLMLTRALAVELAPRLRVCGVTPGLVTPPAEGSPWTGLSQRVPLGREGTPADVGQAVHFLVEADYLTGSVVTVDGGLTSRSL